MLSHAWKKLAKEYDLTIGNGVAYGEFRGYNATFSDGSNTKRVDFSVYVPDNCALKNANVAPTTAINKVAIPITVSITVLFFPSFIFVSSFTIKIVTFL